jgi:putative ABC transport system permease protein
MSGNAGRSFYIEGKPLPAPNDTPGGRYTVTCPDYFRTMGVPILRGREFTQQDTASSTPVVIINQSMAQKYWGAEDAVGKRIDVDQQGHWQTIVGVVGDMHHSGLAQKTPRQLFRPYTQAAWPWMQVVVRTEGDPLSFTRVVKDAMLRVEPERGVSKMRTMSNIVESSVGSRRFPMMLLAAFSALALVLAAIGIVGVVSYSVTQRRNEIGIRMALGAKARDVLTLIVGGSMRWVLLGVVAGIAGSLLVTRFLVSLLYDVKPADPMVLGGVVGLLLAVALTSSYACARRATTVDPLVTLRSE